MLISVGIDPAPRNTGLAIITPDLKILKLMKAPFYTVKVKSKIKKKLKLNKESGKYELDNYERAWTDYTKMRDIFIDYINEDIIYTVERVSSRKGEGEVTSFIFGDSFGIFHGLYAFLNPKYYYEPPPQKWKEKLGVTSDKQTSINLVKKIFSGELKKLGIDFNKEGKHDDLAEALLLALYGLNEYMDEIERIEENGKKENKGRKRRSK